MNTGFAWSAGVALWAHFGAPGVAAAPTRPDVLIDEVLRDTYESGHDEERRKVHLLQLIAEAKTARALAGGVNLTRPEFECPPPGSGVGGWRTSLDEHHFRRHADWANSAGFNFCRTQGLWTNGCGVNCALTAAVIGSIVGLGPGQLVIDVGSGCGHYASWLHEWFGARTLGVDFVPDAVFFARRWLARAPARFCWFNVATHGHWLPTGVADLAVASSVLHYLRTDTDRFETGPDPVGTVPDAPLTPCGDLERTEMTQCRAAREMFRSVRVGGHVWIAHNGSYRAKWDPTRVWGPDYWKCCFKRELDLQIAYLVEVPELELFMQSPAWDPTYSVILRRLGPD